MGKEGVLMGEELYSCPGKERNVSQHSTTAEEVESCECHYEYKNENVYILAHFQHGKTMYFPFPGLCAK